jgi:hypothetical protein
MTSIFLSFVWLIFAAAVYFNDKKAGDTTSAWMHTAVICSTIWAANI